MDRAVGEGFGRGHRASVTTPTNARTSADHRLDAVRDAPEARLRLLSELADAAPALARYGRPAESFMRWQLQRGLLSPPDAAQPGSAWWRSVNERLLRDQTEAVVAANRATPHASGEASVDANAPSAHGVDLWRRFLADPTPAGWYRAHNASVVRGYVDALPLAAHETSAERFFMNVALTRVLFAHALVAAPRLALGPTRPLAPHLGDPRRGLAGRFLALDGVLPDRYPLTEPIGFYVVREHPLARLLDLSVIRPRLAQLYDWSASELAIPELRDFADGGRPVYAADGDAAVWPRARDRRTAAALSLVTRPSAAR